MIEDEFFRQDDLERFLLKAEEEEEGMEGKDEEEEEEDEEDEEEEEGEVSSYLKKMKKMKKKIAELEEELVAPKSWQMSGEVISLSFFRKHFYTFANTYTHFHTHINIL